MSFTIVTDSSANLLDETIDKNDIKILPLTFMVDDVQHTSYSTSQASDLAKFYKMMRDGKVITTSLPNLQSSKAMLEEILKSGSDLYYIGFSSGLSGTYTAIELILKELAATYPKQKVLSTDTLAASYGEGMLVCYAIDMRSEGKSIDEVFEWVEKNKLRLAHWFTVDDLHYLERGGRVSKTAAFAGTMLNIKPVLHVDNEGHLIPMQKVRGRKKSLDALVSHMEQSIEIPYKDKVFISHGDCLDDANYVADKVKEKFGIDDVSINILDPVIGAHSGPGTMALYFLGNER